MKYWKDENNNLRQMEEDQFKRLLRLQPETKEVIPDGQDLIQEDPKEDENTNEINKLETLKTDENNSDDPGANTKRQTKKGSAAKAGNKGVLGKAKAKQGGGKKVQASAKKTTTRRTTTGK